MKNVIVTDVRYRMALAPIRELAKKGYRITACEFLDTSFDERLGFFSKYVSDTICLEDTEQSFCDEIMSLSKNDRPVLIPTNRKSLTKVIHNKNYLSSFCDFLVPDKKAIDLADDKDKMAQIAKKIGVPIPKTTSLKEHSSIEEMAKLVHYPCIIKFRNGEAMGKKPEQRYAIVNNIDDFIKNYTKMHEEDPYPIASDYIKGHDIGVAVVMDKNHKAVDFLCYESLREYPIKGGPTCYLKTFFDRKLLEYSVRLLEEIDFCGIAMLDFRGTPKNPFFLEINPRIWGSAAICDISDSTFFQSYVNASCEKTEPLDIKKCVPKYKLNAKMRFTPQNILCFLSNMKNSKNKLKILIENIISLFDFSIRDGLFSIKDIKPYIKYIKTSIKRS